jgi:Ig-like domain CHU_C associated
MNRLFPILKNCRVLTTRLGSLLLLFQRAPLVQMLFPEARLLGGAGLGKITCWTATTIAGLGAYDTVAGASGISQIAPAPGSTTVPAAKGSALVFIFQSTGTEEAAASWQVIGKLPSGLVHRNVTNNSIDSISGVPSQSGNFPITVKAWEKAGFQGESLTKSFTINVGPAIISRQPSSITIPGGTSTTLSVTGSGTGLTYQWFMGKSPNTKKPVAKATKATFKTPALTVKTLYWVRVTRGGIVANSKTATVGITPAAADAP